mgnify:CR=1 FL=1
MRSRAKRLLAGVLTCSLLIGCNGCGIDKKEPKPTPKALIPRWWVVSS